MGKRSPRKRKAMKMTKMKMAQWMVGKPVTRMKMNHDHYGGKDRSRLRTLVPSRLEKLRSYAIDISVLPLRPRLDPLDVADEVASVWRIRKKCFYQFDDLLLTVFHSKHTVSPHVLDIF